MQALNMQALNMNVLPVTLTLPMPNLKTNLTDEPSKVWRGEKR